MFTDRKILADVWDHFKDRLISSVTMKDVYNYLLAQGHSSEVAQYHAERFILDGEGI